MKAWWFLKALKMIVLGTLAVLVFGGIISGLWNALVPELFHGPVITFWQAIGLFVLTHLLFRGAGGYGHGWKRARWKNRFEEKLAAMTPEERESFRAEYRRRCGGWPGRHTVDEPGSADDKKL